jgi:thiol-disulfide isomerase/thioredoxin
LKSVENDLLFSGAQTNIMGYGDCTELEFAPIRTALQDTQPLRAVPRLSDAQLPTPGIDAVSGTMRPTSFDKPSKPSGKEARVTMVRAEWCGFCKKAMPEWNKLTSEHDGKVVKDHKLSFRDLEQKQDEEEIKSNYSDVRGFPTYVVEIMINGKLVKKESFNGIEKKDMESKLLNILN